MKAQVFFTTRSAARVASFGKMTDNGSTSEKRWARTVEVTPSSANVVETLVCCHDRRNMNNAKTVTVMVKRRRSN